MVGLQGEALATSKRVCICNLFQWLEQVSFHRVPSVTEKTHSVQQAGSEVRLPPSRPLLSGRATVFSEPSRDHLPTYTRVYSTAAHTWAAWSVFFITVWESEGRS